MVKVAAALSALLVIAMPARPSAQEFDAVSIKRNPTNTFAFGYPPYFQGNQFAMTGFAIKDFILFGYPVETRPVQIIGLPEWAESESYNLIAKGKPDPTPAEVRQMWKALLSDRLRLQAHYETRDREGYHLVHARRDKRLGPELKPAALDCTKPEAPPAKPPSGVDVRVWMAMRRCGIGLTGSNNTLTLLSGSASLADLAKFLSSEVRRPVVDRTGLGDRFAFRLSFVSDRSPAAAADVPDSAPVLLTALQEQLGLKLEPGTVQGQVLVIDRIERPSEN